MTRWVGRSGREYVLEPGNDARDGGMASIRRVVPRSAPNAVSTVPEGMVLALKIARPDDKLATEAIAREVETFVALSRAPGSPPCPRLYDIIGSPVTGLVMEWCPTDMERWWEGTWSAPRAFVELCEAMAELCRRVREFEAVAELELGKRVIHADIKPRNVLRAVDGRWLLTDFGASKSRSVDETQWAATRMILGTENFIAPEALFNARKPHPAAMDTWSLGCTFFALLRMRALLSAGGRMPANGTHAHPFRSQRVALVGDLQQRKPTLFVDKDLDPSAFTSPDKLPEKDRKAVTESLGGIFGGPHATLEGVLANEVLNLLDRALRIDPALRFRDPLEMAGEFEALAQRFRELALRAENGGTGPARAIAPAAAGAVAKAPTPVVVSSGAPAPAGGSGPRAPVGGDSPRMGASAPRVLVSEEIVVEEGSGRKGPTGTGASSIPAAQARIPPWLGVALLAMIGLQLVQIVVSSIALVVALRSPAPVAAAPLPVAAPAPAPSVAVMVQPAPTAEVVPAPVAEAPVEPAAVPATEPAAPAPEPARAAPARANTGSDVVPKRLGTPPPEGSAGQTGVILVGGAQAYLMGPKGRVPPGTVPAGSYELFAQTRSDGEFQSQGTITVNGGERIVYKCGLGTCRALQ